MLKSNLQPESLYSAAQSRELDRIAMEDCGLNDGILMEKAGTIAFQVLRFSWPRAMKVLVIAGPGNNGGDGFVVARTAAEHGLDVKVVLLIPANQYKGDAANALEKMSSADIISLSAVSELQGWQPDVIVDGIFGTGLNREPAVKYLAVIRYINQQPAPVLSLDIPSGLSADTGCPFAEVVQASATISFIGLKPGLVTGQGPQVCGSLYFHNLDVPDEVYENIKPVARVFSPGAKHSIPSLSKTTYKHKQGHVLVAGGDEGMAGAAVMAAEAAYRCGAGLVSLVSHKNTGQQLRIKPEIISIPLVDSFRKHSEVLTKANAIIIGPGLGLAEWGQALFSNVMDSKKIPMVVDADGLRWLANNPQRRKNWVLTPHPGEAAVLLDVSTNEIEADRLQTAINITKKYGGVCVLKGAGTIIASEYENQVFIIRAGNPGMATGGMGDVLAGVIGALMGSGLSIIDSAKVGAWIHGTAADKAAADLGERSLLATDLFEYIPVVTKFLSVSKE